MEVKDRELLVSLQNSVNKLVESFQTQDDNFQVLATEELLEVSESAREVLGWLTALHKIIDQKSGKLRKGIEKYVKAQQEADDKLDAVENIIDAIACDVDAVYPMEDMIAQLEDFISYCETYKKSKNKDNDYL